MTPAPTNTRMAAWLESAWLARYLDRQLDGEELAWFEAYLLDKPELVEAVEADEGLRHALALQGGHAMRPPDAGDLGHAARGNAVRWLGAAACVLGAFGIGRYMTADGTRTQTLIANPTRIVVETLRGGENTPVVDFADGDSPYVFVEVSVPLDAEHIRVTSAGHEVALRASREGFAGFLLSRAALNDHREVVLEYSQGGTDTRRDLKLSTQEVIQ